MEVKHVSWSAIENAQCSYKKGERLEALFWGEIRTFEVTADTRPSDEVVLVKEIFISHDNSAEEQFCRNLHDM